MMMTIKHGDNTSNNNDESYSNSNNDDVTINNDNYDDGSYNYYVNEDERSKKITFGTASWLTIYKINESTKTKTLPMTFPV